MSEYKPYYELELSYDNSDGMSDYYDRFARLKNWVLWPMDGKKVTEKKLYTILEALPKWIHDLKWTLEKGEKYSMSDHPYHTLISEWLMDCGELKVYGGGSSPTRFTLSVSHKMNAALSTNIPPTKDQVKQIITKREQDRLENEAFRKVNPPKQSIPQGATHVIDGSGLRQLTQEERDIGQPKEKLEKIWFKEPVNWKNFTLKL